MPFCSILFSDFRHSGFALGSLRFQSSNWENLSVDLSFGMKRNAPSVSCFGSSTSTQSSNKSQNPVLESVLYISKIVPCFLISAVAFCQHWPSNWYRLEEITDIQWEDLSSQPAETIWKVWHQHHSHSQHMQNTIQQQSAALNTLVLMSSSLWRPAAEASGGKSRSSSPWYNRSSSW